MESWRPKTIHKYNNQKAYGRTKANAPCRKHPKHTQSPGVCSLCLNKKLFQLTNTSAAAYSRRRRAANPPSSSSSSSSYISSLSSSDDDSSYLSPSSSTYMGSGARKSTTTGLFKNIIIGQETLKKSRSMAFCVQRRREEDRNENGNSVEIKRGFWSKLLPRKSKALMHSRTTRERVVQY